MRLKMTLVLGLSAALWMGVAQAEEAAGSVQAPAATVQEAPPAPVVEATPVSATPPSTWQPAQGIDVRGGEIRLGTIQVSQARDHASYLATPFGTIMPPAQQRAFESATASAEQVVQSRWGNLEHLAGATYGSAIRLNQSDFERKTALDVWEALKSEPGVRIDQTGRRAGEGTIKIRGSSRHQVGMYIDDVPVATSWRNEWDASNYLLYDLASLEVTKGFSSPLLTSNNGLAGIVNMRTAKPTEKFEASVKYMNFFDRDFDDQGRMVAASVGSRQEKFYFKATAILNEQDYFMLPRDYEPGLYEDGGRRDNFNSRNRNLNLIFGWTPNDRVDVMFGFVRQLYKKGYVVNAAKSLAADPANGYPGSLNLNSGSSRYIFSFPQYETTRYYVNANFQLTDKLHLKTVAYYDKHIDRSTTHDSRNNGAPRPSGWQDGTYDQYTAGGQVRLDYVFNDMHQVSASAGWRRLSHEEYTDYTKPYEPPYRVVNNRDCREDYLDFGGEYTFRPIEPLAFVLGGSFTRLDPQKMETNDANWDVVDELHGVLGKPKHLHTWQIGVFYDITENHQIYATFAKKSRFATMRERYSRGNLEVGADVDPEHAKHYEIGYRGLFCDWLQINASVYHSDIEDMIASRTTTGGETEWYNLGRAKFYGFEFAAEAIVNDYLRIGANFAAMKSENKSDNSHLTNLPNVTSTIYAIIQPIEKLSIIPQVDMTSHFYRDSNATRNYYTKSPGFVTADLKAVYDVNEHFTVEAGARNIFDKEYAYSSYYPQQGRNFFLGITARW